MQSYKSMTRILSAIFLAGVVFLTGCETLSNPSLTPEEQAIRDFDFEGVRIGTKPGSLAIFSQVQRVPIKRDGMVTYEVANPTSQVSMLIAFYHEDRLRKVELRYFDGSGSTTLTRAGGWAGIRNYLIEKYGPPSRFSKDAPIVTNQKGINAQFAKFNGEWVFSRVNRQMNYVAMADDKGGVGVVTIFDTTPLQTPIVTRTVITPPPGVVTPVEVVAQRPVAPNPGF